MSALRVIAYQACKAKPSNPGNKIAFTLDGHLCFVVVPEVAHAVIKQADELAATGMRYDGKFCAGLSDYVQDSRLRFVGRILAQRADLATIAKKA